MTTSWKVTPGFRRLCYATFMSQSSFWLAVTVLQWHVAQLSHGDPLAASQLYFCQLAPMFVLPPLSGALLDRFDRWTLIVVSTVISTATAVLLGAGQLLTPHGLGIHACQLGAAAFGTMIAVSTPTFQTMVPNLVGPTQLTTAVSLAAGTLNVARLSGPALGASLLGLGGDIATAAAVIVVLYGATLALMRGVPRTPTPRQASGRVSYLQDVATGFREVASRPELRRSIALVAVTAGFGLAYLSILPAVAVQLLGSDDQGYSALLMVAAVGALAGALGPFKPRTLTQVSYTLLPMAAGALLLTRSTSLPLTVLACLILSTCGTAAMIGLTIHVQHQTPDELRGRVTSVFIWAWGGFLPIGGYLYGTLSDRWSFAAAGAVMAAAIAVSACLNLVPSRGTPTPTPGIST